MLRSKLLITTALCVATALPAMAQPRAFRAIDLNGNGFLSRSELKQAFGKRRGNRLLNSADTNGDGVISARELRGSQAGVSDDDHEDDDHESGDDHGGDHESGDDHGGDHDSGDDHGGGHDGGEGGDDD